MALNPLAPMPIDSMPASRSGTGNFSSSSSTILADTPTVQAASSAPSSTGGTPQLIPSAAPQPPSSNAAPASTPQLIQTPSTPATAGDGTSTATPAPSSSTGAGLLSDVGATTQATGQDPTVAGVSQNELVSKQLTDLLSTGSAYLDLARSNAQQAAAARGLQNSSIAAGSGEAAAIAAGEPIAAGNAQAYQTRTAADLAALNTSSQTKLQTAGDLQKIQTQGAVNAQLQAQAEAAQIQAILTQGTVQQQLQNSQIQANLLTQKLDQGFQINLADTNFQNQQNLIITQFAKQSGLTAQQAQEAIDLANANHQNTIDQIDQQAKLSTGVNASQASSVLQSQYLQAVSQRMTAASQEIQTIYNTQGLTSDQQNAAVANANARMQADLQSIAAFYQASPLWNQSWGQTTSDGGKTVPTTPTQPAVQGPPPPSLSQPVPPGVTLNQPPGGALPTGPTTKRPGPG